MSTIHYCMFLGVYICSVWTQQFPTTNKYFKNCFVVLVSILRDEEFRILLTPFTFDR